MLCLSSLVGMSWLFRSQICTNLLQQAEDSWETDAHTWDIITKLNQDSSSVQNTVYNNISSERIATSGGRCCETLAENHFFNARHSFERTHWSWWQEVSFHSSSTFSPLSIDFTIEATQVRRPPNLSDQETVKANPTVVRWFLRSPTHLLLWFQPATNHFWMLLLDLLDGSQQSKRFWTRNGIF